MNLYHVRIRVGKRKTLWQVKAITEFHAIMIAVERCRKSPLHREECRECRNITVTKVEYIGCVLERN